MFVCESVSVRVTLRTTQPSNLWADYRDQGRLEIEAYEESDEADLSSSALAINCSSSSASVYLSMRRSRFATSFESGVSSRPVVASSVRSETHSMIEANSPVISVSLNGVLSAKTIPSLSNFVHAAST